MTTQRHLDRRNQSRHRHTTIEDVAIAAGVSVATVSRALRNLPNVAQSTRTHVQQVASELDYSPDPAASRLAVGRTQTVTIVVADLTSWYCSTVVAGAEAVCAAAGYDVLVAGIGAHKDLSPLLRDSYHLERRTDGLLVVDIPVDEEHEVALTERGVAITTIGYATDQHPSICIDNVEVGRLAGAHLVDRGHRRFGMIAGLKEDPRNTLVPKLRHQGYVAELARHGHSMAPEAIRLGNFGIDGGREAMVQLLDLDEAPTAVFSMSDEMAFGAIMEIQHRGLRPGHDVAIIGVDDHDFARVVSLTTVRQPVSGLGASGSRLLLDLMERRLRDDDDAPGEVVRVDTPVELVIRSST